MRPEEHVMHRMNRRIAGVGSLLAALLVGSVASSAAAYARGGAVNHPANVQNARANVSNHNGNYNQNRNVNANVNRNTNVNVNRNVDVHGGYGYGGYDHWGHPVATAAAVTATAVAVGTIASTLPSSGCSAVSVGGIGYQRCGPNYYQPQYQGSSVQYVVVAPPQ
jgi:hypothetical protein